MDKQKHPLRWDFISFGGPNGIYYEALISCESCPDVGIVKYRAVKTSWCTRNNNPEKGIIRILLKKIGYDNKGSSN